MARRYGTAQPVSRWMSLKFAGVCKVCGSTVPAGESAFWDSATRKITCHALECCEADGLTRSEWRGSPVSGAFITVRSDRRIGSGYAGA